ncbi:MAG: hypothetical protein M0042_13375 [Nitrospiraceae bacterium]|nr:hypothetical protein [Nitrospiraceae bacterium]
MFLFPKRTTIIALGFVSLLLTSCATAYREKPLPFKLPEAYPNSQEFGGAVIGVRAFSDAKEAKESFGFDVIAAGMLPVEIVIDNKGAHPIEINGSQTFLEDKGSNLWPVLSQNLAYERATKYAQTKETFTGAAQSGFFGAAAGAAIGAAIGILTGHDIGNTIGKGAALGAIGGGLAGGAQSYQAGDARHAIVEDLRQKSLQSKSVASGTLAYGFIFFPAEAKTAKSLRVQLVERDTGKSQVMNFAL